MSSEPDELLSSWIPEGFDEFWASASRLEDVSPSVSLNLVSETETHRISVFSFSSVSGLTLHGWLAEPKDGDGPFPAFLWVPPYSKWSMKPNEYGTRPGFVSMSFNFFGEEAFHDEVYTPERGYFAEGIQSPLTYVFRRLYQDCLVAVQVLAALPQVDATKIASMGMSQGAGLSIWLGAFCPLVKSVVADMPFLGGMRWVFNHKVHRYPLKEITDWYEDNDQKKQQMLRTLAFFDTVNVATRCKVPTLVTAGSKDPAVKVAQAEAIYRELPGKKEFEVLDWGHDWHPSMVSRNLDWLRQTL